MHSKFQTKFKSECVCLFLQLLGDTLARETKRHWEEPAVEIAKKTRIKKLKFSNLKEKMKIEIEIEKKKNPNQAFGLDVRTGFGISGWWGNEKTTLIQTNQSD